MARGNSKFELHFDKEAINEFLREEYPEALRAKAEGVKRTLEQFINDDSIPIEIEDGVGSNGRPYSMVRVKHAKAMNMQLKHGYLTKALAVNGLDVRRKY